MFRIIEFNFNTIFDSEIKFNNTDININSYKSYFDHQNVYKHKNRKSRYTDSQKVFYLEEYFRTKNKRKIQHKYSVLSSSFNKLLNEYMNENFDIQNIEDSRNKLRWFCQNYSSS